MKYVTKYDRLTTFLPCLAEGSILTISKLTAIYSQVRLRCPSVGVCGANLADI